MSIETATLFEVVEFFDRKANAYSTGKLMSVASLYKVPCYFMFGLKKIELQTHSDIEAVMEQYRANLLADGYKRTTVEVLHTENSGPRRIQCLVTYKNLDGSGMLINSEDVSCFLEGNCPADWMLVDVEYVNDPLVQVFAGIKDIEYPQT